MEASPIKTKMKKLFFTALTVIETESELDMPLHKELWQYFYETYINPSEYYENLGADSSTMLSVRLIIFGLFIGLSLASFAAVFNKRVLGNVVRKLLAAEALSPDRAMTLEELGYENNPLIWLALKKSTSLRRVVKCREEVAYDQDMEKKRLEYDTRRKSGEKLPRFKETSYKIDILSDAFYIPEDMKYMADVKFEKKGTTWLGASLTVVVMAVILVALMVAMPHIFELLDSFAAGFDSSGNSKIL